MKHWSEFLSTRTQATNRLGKFARTLTYEVQEKQLQLENAKANLDKLELKICNLVADRYSHENDFTNAIETAKHKAEIYNNEPVNSHK
ncbi:hypothetical protein [Flavobacterium psychrophilum]|uniref:hypothetical protein n=1 Tax=Flavobacterium psychrophilum TaxID=96345 RepID=UPI000B7C1C75|nr:hypothetical protein [Flavobacterium psychrophilum]MCB6089454.1 hypothetical protein [Flavobacterium psychrophilum]MCB6232071.1 hypothetical protein [Flavobacterium psychrophilum]SNA80301.1 hypothetical protein FI146_340007 [Flavobacterium psychrophilum]SNB13525.1 hypothetical protein JIP1600_2250004 [Flavobacterium psychrophilum]